MSRITLISLLILVIGMFIGLFIPGGLSGMIVGFILSGIIAILFYCIANTIKASTIPGPTDPFSDQVQVQNDRSQLPKSAYDLNGGDN